MVFPPFKTVICAGALLCACACSAGVGDRPYVGLGAGAFLPGGCAGFDAAASGAVRAGWWQTETLAFEADGVWASHAKTDGGSTAVSGFDAGVLWRLAGWKEYDMLFGYARFDPFLTAGVGALFAGERVFADDSRRTAVGPTAGFGFFYYLTESLAFRADARCLLGVDGPCTPVFSATAGLQWEFGSAE